MNLGEKDKSFIWHPFTPMAEWCSDTSEPLVIERGNGVYIYDTLGRRYIDGNASIWTNVHGHCHPTINEAIIQQLSKIAHCSFLGTTNEPAILLAEKLIGLFPSDSLQRAFFSDDGSTAIECAMKMAIQYFQIKGEVKRQRFVTFDNAYHGDTLGASSLGGVERFFARFSDLGLPVIRLNSVEELNKLDCNEIAAVVLEPMVQGAAGIRLWPEGMLSQIRNWCDSNQALLILDEVMTGFGRTGKMFACEHEGVVPDIMALAKGLTGGYVPLAATLTTADIFDAFLDGQENTFYYGHSYSGNPIGCAAALASLKIFEIESTLSELPEKINHLNKVLEKLKTENQQVMDVRQCGLISGIELLGNGQIIGPEVCNVARDYGLLTRAVGNTVVFMPPLVIKNDQISDSIIALQKAIEKVLG
ncbi:MAG: adenosylmethionine--8-amino-7-oxononanoate transaminase [Akkermansiaceae bacterium]|nr:adenosylmethionine--8-amino-7-oxononanoate transaminase [Akkermansiaceae bacterium]MDG1852736.1 adenosylmethionine--8-amino-7-oxononanoate transaminase [Verrucomicrobiales bacterium]